MKFYSFIKNYLYDKNYSICIFEDFVYFYNYNKIIELNDDYLLVSFENFLCRVIGDNFIIKKLYKNELLIKGNIKKVFYE